MVGLLSGSRTWGPQSRTHHPLWRGDSSGFWEGEKLKQNQFASRAVCQGPVSTQPTARAQGEWVQRPASAASQMRQGLGTLAGRGPGCSHTRTPWPHVWAPRQAPQEDGCVWRQQSPGEAAVGWVRGTHRKAGKVQTLLHDLSKETFQHIPFYNINKQNFS